MSLNEGHSIWKTPSVMKIAFIRDIDKLNIGFKFFFHFRKGSIIHKVYLHQGGVFNQPKLGPVSALKQSIQEYNNTIFQLAMIAYSFNLRCFYFQEKS